MADWIDFGLDYTRVEDLENLDTNEARVGLGWVECGSN